MEEDKRIMEEIREMPVDVPDSLSPEKVTAYLKENGKNLRKREDTRKVIRLRTFLCAAAAVLAMAIVIPSLISLGKKSQSRNAGNLAAVSRYESGEAAGSEAAMAPAGGETILTFSGTDTAQRPDAVEESEGNAETAFAKEGQELIRRSEAAFAEKTGTGQPGGEKAARIPLSELLKKAASYEELQKALGSNLYNGYYDYGVYYESEEKGLSVNGAEAGRDYAEAPGAAEDQSASDHSSTNTREANVDEGDVVKTDGKFIYQLKRDSRIRIVRADAGKLEEVSMLKPAVSGSGEILDLYLTGDQIVLITSEKSSALSQNEDEAYYVDAKNETHVRTYDLGDRTAPKEVGNVVLEGRYKTSRIAEGVVYVVTDKTQERFYRRPYYYDYEPVRSTNILDDFFEWLGDLFPAEDTASDAAVSVKIASKADASDKDTEDAQSAGEKPFDEAEFLAGGTVPKINGKYLATDSIYIPKIYSYTRSWLISSVRLSEPTKAADAQLICTDLSEIYVSSNALFLIGSSEADYEGANVIRVDFADGAIRPTGAVYLPGTVDDSFSVSESADGHFRAAVTRGWNGTNSVYVFDKEMNLTGSLENIIEGEEIKSARYIGDILYLVTYRNTDPLFSVDLSDPAAPKLLGELKIPGFSEYLHPYGDGRLLGLGYETDPKTGDTLGTKLSLFDISDPANVKELSKLVLRNVEPSAALENYKSVLAEPEKNLFGFAAEEAWWTHRWDDVLIYEEETGLVTDEEGEEVSPETLAKDGLKYLEEKSPENGEESVTDEVAEGLVFTDGTTEAVSEKKTDGKKKPDAKKDDGRTADVRMQGGAAYLLFGVENDKIVCRLVRSFGSKDEDGRWMYGYSEPADDCRGIYIGDTFYIVEKNITAFNMADDYKEIGSLAG